MEWEELYKSSSATPFQSFTFQYSSWINMVSDGTLHIIAIIREKDKSAIAVFPTYIDRCGILRFINGRHIDFCSALVLPEFERDYHLYEELADYIKNNSKIKGFELDNLQEDNYLSAILCYFFKGSLVSITNHWSFACVKSNEETLKIDESIAYLNREDRYRIRKLKKKSEVFVCRIFCISTNKFPKEYLDEIIRFMINVKIRTEAYFSHQFLRVVEDCYNDGVIKLIFTFSNSEPVACNICMDNNAEYINWLSVYKNNQFTSLNLLQTLDKIHTNGGGTLNFARGIYEYKIRNFKPEIHNLYKISYRKSNCGKIGLWMNVCIYYLKQVVKSIIRK